MKNYYRIMLGPRSMYAETAYKGNFIGCGWLGGVDLSNKLPENWKDFNRKFVPIYMNKIPGSSKVSAGLGCGMLWTVSKGILTGDIVLCPDGKGSYMVGEVTGDYQHEKSGTILPHRRAVKWFPQTISRDNFSDSLRNSAGSIGTVCNITKYAEEIEGLISGNSPDLIVATDETIEDPSVFALEKHLEDFLVQNWKHTELGKKYEIYSDESGLIGQQYPSDTGPIDILAISKNKKEILVVELKKGRISDVVIGQIQRYMGYVKEELAEKDQKVSGVIIALEDDIRLRRALAVTENIDFYTYNISFKLIKS